MNHLDYIKIAQIVGSSSTCPRASVGALVVSDDRIIATGYNGSPSKTDECIDVGCHMHNGHCIRTTHAEVNALLQCSKTAASTAGATIYCSHTPCLDCTKAIINAGIKRIFYAKDYGYLDDRQQLRTQMLEQAGVETIKVDADAFD